MKRLVTCPHCRGRVKPIPVLYGYPTEKAWEAAKRGELVIGGCVPGFGPEAVCPVCQAAIDGPRGRVDRQVRPTRSAVTP